MTTFMPLMTALKTGEFEIAEMIEKKDLRWTLYQKEAYIDEVKHSLKRFLYLGYFEDIQ